MIDANDAYLRVREKEGRLYSDELVAQLPRIPSTHPLADEWRARAGSAKRLSRYLSLNNKNLTAPIAIMELGCGNGWLTNYLAQNLEGYVWGVDRNPFELAQAARVFGGDWRLGFARADIFSTPFASNRFDVIVLASVIQYFPDLSALISRLLSLLNAHGELHLLDSPLYETESLASAQARSQAYYAGLGVPEMASWYYHHAFESIAPFQPKVLYEPNAPMQRMLHRLGLRHSVFPWIKIGACVDA